MVIDNIWYYVLRTQMKLKHHFFIFNNEHCIYFYRVSNSWRRRRPDGWRNLDGRVFKLFSVVLAWLGFRLSCCRHPVKREIPTFTVYEPLIGILYCTPSFLSICKISIFIMYYRFNMKFKLPSTFPYELKLSFL